MRLGTKFMLLIIGTLAAPILASALVALLVFFATPNGIGPAESIRTVLALRDLRRAPVAPSRVPGILEAAAPDNDILILDDHQKILYSSFPTSLQEMVLDPRWKTQTSRGCRSTAPDGSTFFVIVAFHLNEAPAPWLGHAAPLIVVGSLVGFMILMSIVIIRSINRSIARLEEGTRRIAAGDLDFELAAEGGDRIGSLTRSFDLMRRRVKEAAEARSRFIMSVSHDLKTPLSSITGYLDAIEDGLAKDPEQLAKYLAIIRDKSGLLESRIGQLIDYVKLETGESDPLTRVHEARLFLAETAAAFSSEAEVRGFSLALAIDVPQAPRSPWTWTWCPAPWRTSCRTPSATPTRKRRCTSRRQWKRSVCSCASPTRATSPRRTSRSSSSPSTGAAAAAGRPASGSGLPW